MPCRFRFLALLLTPALCAACGQSFPLANPTLRATVEVRNHALSTLTLRELPNGQTRTLRNLFTVTLANGTQLSASSLPLASMPTLQPLPPQPAAARLADKEPGQQLCATLLPPSPSPLALRWCAVLRTGSHYLRQTLTLTATAEAPITSVTLLALPAPAARLGGTTAGSPIVDRGAFFAFEHPLATTSVRDGGVLATLERTLPLRAGQSITYSSVVGFAPAASQMRRAFLCYLERERAHPYRPFLTYNSWYDLGFGERYAEAGALDRVTTVGRQLSTQRGVQLNSFLFDDGWDNPQSLWQFNAQFPHGMAAVTQRADALGAGVGMWLSPWGGYGQAKQGRIAYGLQHGYEIVHGGYALSGPRYYQAFEQTCLALLRTYGVNQFKLDGTGNANQVFAGSAFDSDFDAAIHLIERLRQAKPDLFINLTTGTYPSPFWLRYADSIWRGGEDNGFAGVGSWRQRWITYRDSQTYKNIVRAGPLFPLNSLMLHSIIYARQAQHLGGEPATRTGIDRDFADEVWSLFGSGTDLQELYITPSLLNHNNWDTLAAAAHWSRANRGTLVDTHWVGGDPAQLAVYGWASWSPRRHDAILVLRNPADHPQTFLVDPQKVFELPSNAPRPMRLADPRQAEPAHRSLQLTAGQAQPITLAPWEVAVLQSF